MAVRLSATALSYARRARSSASADQGACLGLGLGQRPVRLIVSLADGGLRLRFGLANSLVSGALGHEQDAL